MFWERLLELCNQKKTNPSKVAADLNLSNATAVKWKKGSIPNGNTLELLSNYFGVTTDYLLGLSDCRTAEETADVLLRLSEQEKILIKFFRDTTEEGRLEMIAAIMQIKKSVEKKNTDSDSEAIG